MSRKIKDNKNRHRNKTVAFRVSPEEWEQFGVAVKLSGLTKQEYLIRRMQDRKIVVQGSPRVYKALRDGLCGVLEELRRINSLSESQNAELLETIGLITTTLDGLKREEKY